MATGKFNLPIASGGVEPQITGYTVNFYDIDGTILKSEIVQEGGSATPPTANYDPDYLTFYEWNNSYTGITSNTEIGALYETMSGYTYFTLGIISGSSLSINIYLNGINKETTIDYGDGKSQTIYMTGNTIFSNTYSNYGNYIVKIMANNIKLGWNSSTNRLTNYNSYLVGNCYIGSSHTFQSYSLYQNNIEVFNSINTSGYTDYSNQLRESYSLKHINLPKNISNYGTNLFSNSYKLKNAIFPKNNGNKTTGGTIFVSCYNLESIDLSDNTFGAMGSSNFSNCSGLKKVILNNGTVPQTQFSNCYSLSDVTFPKNLTSLGISFFNNCYNLNNLILPSGTTSLPNTTFSNCYGMKVITFLSVTPPTITTTTFSGCINFKIYVPDASVNAYKTATNWITYAPYIYPISQKPS